MRLRPSKGEGERSKSIIKKGPLLITTALLVGYPVCVAQAVTYSALGLPTQQQSQTVKPSWQQSQPRNYLSLRLIASVPSNQDLLDLQSTLDSYISQLSTLKASKPLDPDLDTQIAQEISYTESKIQLLTNKILRLKTDLAALKLAKGTLTSALERFETANTKQSTAKTELDLATETHTKASAQSASDLQALQLALVTLEDFKSATTKAQDLVTLSQTAIEVQAGVIVQAQQALEQQQQTSDEAQAKLAAAQQTLDQATSALEEAARDRNKATVELRTKQEEVSAARETYNQVVSNYNQILDTYTTVYNEYLDAQETLNITRTNLQEATNQLNQAQSDYDNLLIPDPTWTPLTYEQEHERLVPTTTIVPVTTTTLTGGLTADVFNRQGYNNAPPLPTSNERPIYTTIVPDINFNWGSGQVLNSGRSEDVIVRFTGNISFPTSGNYQFHSPADDGTILQIDGVQIISDWRDKGGGGSTSAPVYFEGGSTHTITLYYYENGGGANVWLYYYTPQTGYVLVPPSHLGTTSTTTTTYVEQTVWDYETYYTTEVIPGQVHPLIHDPALLPNLQNAQIYYDATVLANQQAEEDWQIAQANQQQAAQNSTTAYYQVIDTATSLNTLSSELDVKQITSNQAESSYDSASQTLRIAQQDLTNKQSTFDEESTKLQTKKNTLSTEVRQSQALQTSNEALNQDLRSKQATQLSAQETYDLSVTTSSTSTSNEASAKATLDIVAANYAAAQDETSAATSNKTAAEDLLAEAEAAATTSNEEASTLSSQISLSQIKDLLNQEPPKKEEGSAEIPAVIEDLMQVDLAAVDPTELTPAQAEQLVEAALVAFETATEGSAEYEQALDALALAAQQDDIVVDESIANIPGVGQAAVAIANVLNLVGNVGADISPKKRKEAQNLVVTTLVVGQIAQAAALATASSSGGSSNRTIRRK
jgi:hypothetical protein